MLFSLWSQFQNAPNIFARLLLYCIIEIDNLVVDHVQKFRLTLISKSLLARKQEKNEESQIFRSQVVLCHSFFPKPAGLVHYVILLVIKEVGLDAFSIMPKDFADFVAEFG